jgi:hypothetical protein
MADRRKMVGGEREGTLTETILSNTNYENQTCSGGFGAGVVGRARRLRPCSRNVPKTADRTDGGYFQNHRRE